MNQMQYKETSLWKASFSNKNDGDDELRKRLEGALDDARENASYILNKIGADFPSLTVHDVTHADGLWKVGSVIAGEGYDLNPLEGFVLGCAFLMHDAALSYYAVGGKDKLRETVEWKDIYADYKSKAILNDIDKEDETDFRTIRVLHAKYVRDLYDRQFVREGGTQFYIIEDESLRNHLGPKICEIAASHNLNVDDLVKLDTQFSALPDYPREWRINPMKLACLLRCADAGHIDSGRAPDRLLKLLTVNGVSRDHWIGQNHLSQIDVDVKNTEKVIISSNINFKEDDFAAWNVVYDAVCLLDHEIRASNDLLAENGIRTFAIKGVSGVESRQMFSKYVQTEGWTPCDLDIHISNVKGLIENLGGEQLYGRDNKLETVLRELIQNARDAIVARRQKESGFKGKISVEINKTDGKTWVTVKDDGVGMSMPVIKEYFLNFGNCFWGSDLAKSEHPGLTASSFKSVGKFGIGFFSIFMVAAEVIVETRKYRADQDKCIRLKFYDGLCLWPIVSIIQGESQNSTIIRFSLDEKKCEWDKQFLVKSGTSSGQSFSVPYSSVLSRLTAGLDVDVYYSESNSAPEKIHIDILSPDLDKAKWLKDITYAEYHGDNMFSDYIDKNHNRVKPIYNNGTLYGLAALNTIYDPNSFFSVTTVGGLHYFNHFGNSADFLGCVLVEPETARREGKVDKDIMRDWAKKQYDILCDQGLSDLDKLMLPYIVGEYGIDMTDVMHIRVINKNRSDLKYELKKLMTLMKSDGLKLVFQVFTLSSTSRRVNSIVDLEKILPRVNKNELFFLFETNSNFLDLKKLEEESCDIKYNILECIQLAAEKLQLKLSINFVSGKLPPLLGSNGEALVVSVK